MVRCSKLSFVFIITLLSLGVALGLTKFISEKSDAGKNTFVEWNNVKINFPLQRKISLTYLNKPINVRSATQLPNGLIEIYSRDAILLFDGKKLIPHKIPGHPDLHPRLSAKTGNNKFYIDRAHKLYWDSPGEKYEVSMPVDTNARFIGMVASDRHLVVATADANMIIFNQDKRSFRLIKLPVANEVFGILKDNLNQIWIATDGGIFVYKMIATKMQLIRHLNQSNSIPDNLTTSITFDGNKTMIFGTYESGLFSVNTERFQVTRAKTSIKNRINYISYLDAAHLIISVENEGILLVDPNSELAATLLKNTIGREVRSICILDEGWVTVFTKEGDVMMVNPVVSTIQPDIKGLQCIRQANDRIYLGTSDGLYQYNNDGSPTLVRNTAGLNIVSLYHDESGSLWIGTYGQGLYRMTDGKVSNIDKKYSIDKNIMSMDGSGNNVFLATLSGAYGITLDESTKRQITQVKNFQHENSISARFIYSVTVDAAGNAWFGSDGKGLWKLEKDMLVPAFKAQFNNRSVQSVYALGKHLLLNLDGSEFEQFSLEKSDSFRIHYKTGNISGFTEVDSDWSCTYSEGKLILVNAKDRKSLLYDDLFDEKSFQPTLNSACKLNDGSSLICTDDEIIRIANTAFIKRTSPATVFHSVTPVSDANGTLQKDFKYDENTIEINYSGVWFNDPDKISFRYRLKNYEDHFKTTLDNHVFYTNLPPGKYNFEMETVCEQIDSIPKISTYEFSISKPYYATWWFRMIAFTALVSIIYFVVKGTERSKRKKQKLESEKLEAQISILKSQINPHFLFNSFNTLTALIEEDPNNAHRYIDKLSSFYRALLTINEDTHTVSEELTVLKDFYFLLKQRFGDNLDLEINVRDDAGLIPPLTFQLLFENVINHNVISRTKPMKVNIDQLEDGSIIFSNIKQRKSVKTPGTGIGLENIRNRFRLMFGKELIVRDTAERFDVILPYANKVKM